MRWLYFWRIKLKIKIIDFDDINDDGTAIIWWFRDGGNINKEFECRCIYKMLKSEELFNIIFGYDCINIDKNRFFEYCNEKI